LVALDGSSRLLQRSHGGVRCSCWGRLAMCEVVRVMGWSSPWDSGVVPGRLWLGVGLHGIYGCLHFLESLLGVRMAILVRVELLRQFAVELGEIGGLHDWQSLDQHVLGCVNKFEHQIYLLFYTCYILEAFLLYIGFCLLGCLLVNLSLQLG
jgi:hypothetical protein